MREEVRGESFPRLRRENFSAMFQRERAVPEPSERRAKTGLYKCTFFKRKAVVIVCFKTCRDGVF